MAEVVEAVVADEGSKQDSKGRRILDEPQWKQMIPQYQASRLTQVQFARREVIIYHTFVARLGRLRRAQVLIGNSIVPVRLI